MKKKHFKSRHALLMSLTSLTLCVSMLFGATFAWFTDSVTSGVNRIVSGNLDVELYHRNSDVTANTPVGSSTQLFNSKISEEAAEYELWEPGAVTYEVFTVENRGTLALKYQLNAILANIGTEANPLYYNTVMDANGNNTGANLTQVLRVKEIDGDANLTARPDYTTSDGITLGEYLAADHYTVSTLQPNETKTTTIVLFWPQSAADNTWNLQNGKYASDSNAGEVGQLKVGLAINLVATQYTSEADSFGIDYDAAADGVNSYELATAIDSNVSKTLAASNISATANATEYTALVSTPEATTATTISDAAATSTIPANTTATLTLGENQSIDVGTDKMTALSREIRTTENSSNSVTYDISYNATVTTTTGEEQTATATYAVHTFDKIVTNEINVGTGLLNVSVTHGSAAMNKLTTNGVPANPNEKGDFYYDAGTGKLYIYSKTYSEYKVSFEQAEVSVVNNGTTTNMTLAAFRTGVNDGTYANATVTLLRNVNLGGAEWTPIGTKDHPFSGVFDGNGKTISNFKLSGSGEKNPIALFGYIKGTASSFTSTTALSKFYNDSYEVTLPNETVFGCEVKNLTVSGVTANTTADGWTAAAVAYCVDATVKNVTVTNSTLTANEKVGGVVAFVPNDAAAFIDGCKTTSDVTVTASTGNHAAGILARVDGILSRVIISNCTNNATISSAGVNAGGITGQAKYTLIYSCTNNGNVTGGTRSAGITTDSSGSVIINCLNTGSITSSKAGTKSDESTAGIYAYAATTGTNIVVNCTNTGSVTANCSDSAIVSGIMGGGADTGDKILNCVNKGTLTNLASSGLVYDISSLSKTETSVAPTDLSALNAELAKGNKNIKITSSLDLTSTDCTIAPRAQEYITFDHTPGYLTIDMTNVQPSSLAITVNNTTINVTGNSAKSLNIIGEGNTITTNGNDLKLANLTVTNNSNTKSTISVSSPAVRLALGGTGVVEATVTSGTAIDKVNFSGTGTYTLTNRGTISHTQSADKPYGNEHTVCTIVGSNITINNYGKIEAKKNANNVCSYAMLFYGGCKVIVNQYPGSSIKTDATNGGYLLACTSAKSVVYNTCDINGNVTQSVTKK